MIGFAFIAVGIGKIIKSTDPFQLQCLIKRSIENKQLCKLITFCKMLNSDISDLLY
jgi:hypothetical protein